MNALIMKCVFGSHLYGLDGPTSDRDYKGIYLPTFEDTILQRVGKSINESSGNSDAKNSSDDVDYECFSLHHFFRLACKNEMVLMDMLMVPRDSRYIVKHTRLWEEIQKNREKFYSKNFTGLLSYIHKQASKYAVKGDRMKAVQDTVDLLKTFNSTHRIGEYWDKFPEDEFREKSESGDEVKNQKDLRVYTVCGRQLQATITVAYALSTMELVLDNYGKRAKIAMDSEGVDWKAISHGFRCCYQLQELTQKGFYTLPFTGEKREFLLNLKNGNFHYHNEGIGEQLSALIEETTVMVDKSDIRSNPDYKFWDDMLLNIYQFLK